MRSESKTKLFLNINEVWDFYRADLERVEDTIQKSLNSPVALINEVANYILSSGGKRIRPLLLMITSRLNGEHGHDQADVLLASSVEFIHTATLLHDDVIDQADVRRGKKSAHTLWGNQASILVGDFLYTQAVRLALGLASQAVNITLADACRLMTEGETLQLAHHGNLEITEQEYVNVIRYKTGALLSATCRLGGILSGLEEDDQESLAQFGLHLGIAYQLADDTLDYIANEDLLGKSLGKDLMEGKITLPLLHLINNCSGREREKVKAIVKADSISPEELQDILFLMKKNGSIDYALRKAIDSTEKAKKKLDFTLPSTHRQALCVVADYAVTRDH
jgi:octaprenyl-diphosphate synthase